MKAGRERKLVVALALLLLSPARATTAPLSDIETRGKQLYFSGIDAKGPEPKALLGSDFTPAPARLAPCASCHGDDGAGRPEGAIVPPAINWRRLTRTTAAQANGGPHQPYPEEILQQAIAGGVNSAGRRLDAVMPRYVFSPDQLQALIAYLKAIEIDQSPGVFDDAVRIAVTLPERENSSASALMTQTLSAYASDVNERGGIFNRRLEFVMLDTADAAERLEALWRDRAVFAILAMESGEQAHAIERLAEEPPIISSVDVWPRADRKTAYGRFSLFANEATQLRIMVDYVAQLSPRRPPRFATLFPNGAALVGARKAIAEKSFVPDGPAPIKHTYDAARFDARAAVSTLSAQGADAVVFVGDGAQFAALLTALQEVDWRPYLLIPGATASVALFDAPKDIADKILLAFPMRADDASKNESLVALQQSKAIPRRFLASQLTAYCTAQILAQGLKLAGRELTRAKFLAALESLQAYDAGLLHPIAFGPNQHVGSPGAYIFGVQKEEKTFRLVSDWIAPK